MSSLLSDLAYALRALTRQPGYSVVVALTLALGLGLNATVLGMMDALLLRPVRFQDSHRLVILREIVRGASEGEAVAPGNFLDWRDQARTVERLAAWQGWNATLTGNIEPERVQAYRVSPGFFELLGVTPAQGRTFTPDEEQPGNDRRVIIGDGLWKRRFAADPAVVGRQVLLDQESYTVIGIAPPRFEFPVAADMWAPLALTPEQGMNRRDRTLTVVGKLAPGRSEIDARAEMELIARRLEQQHPATNQERGVMVSTLSAAMREGGTVTFVAILQAGALLVLLVACANLVSLLLSRAIDRQRELAVRTALGASRPRLIRQLVLETILLGLVASVLALVIARIGLNGLRAGLPADMARYVEGWNNLRLDSRLIAAVPVLAMAVGLLVGLFPAMSASRTDVNAALREGARGAIGGGKRQGGRQALVVVEVSLALALLIAASLTLAGGVRLVNQPGGFDAANLLTLEVTLPPEKVQTTSTRDTIISALLTRIETMASVERAAAANVLPGSGWSPSAPLHIEGAPEPTPGLEPQTGYRVVSPDYFDAMRIPILDGRPFSTFDREDTQQVAIVSKTMASRFWPGGNPLGRRLRLAESGKEWITVVGIAGDVSMYNWWDGIDYSAVYRPLRQATTGSGAQIVVRTRDDPASAAAAIRAAIRSAEPSMPIHQLRTMRQGIEESGFVLHYLALLMVICGAIAVALSVAGIYSVMAYAMSQRTHEIGIRLALGATPRDVLYAMLRRAGTLTAIGLGIGVVLAAVFGRLLASALYGLVALDPLTFAGGTLILAVVSLAAAYVPARRVLRFDPTAILRM